MIRRLLMYLFLLSNVYTSASGQQQPRLQWSINDSWKYLSQGADFAQRPKADDSKWQSVNIPHTWNAKDPFDDDETSRRDISWYRKKVMLDKRFQGKKIYLNFEGAYQVADVYVNGVFAGQHKGGYTAFTFDITHLVKLGDTPTENLIAVQLNNAQDNFIPPLSIGYASYGGIYRDAWLISTNKLHFKMLDHGSPGVFISTPKVDSSRASVNIKGTVSNDDSIERKFEMLHVVYDARQKEVARVSKNYTVAPGKELVFALDASALKNPELWSPDKPYLYTVKSRLIESGQVIDELSNPLGFRWFSFDANKGFSLNGKKLVLKGTNRHQDMKDHGDALSAEDHYRDLKLIKDMGCNFLRLAHYPQAPEVLKLADKLGILIWEEIPLVNYMNPVPEFLKNSKTMIKEMIRQNYNHPSVIIWGSMNEVLLWSEKAERIQVQENAAYVNKVKMYAVKLDSTVRAEDPYRYSTMAMHMGDDYDKYGLSDIPQLASYNIYNGWYSGKSEEFKPTIDNKHRQNPRQVLFISEYGAEADNRVNTEKPQRFDFTGQYQRLYHESYLSQMKQMPYLAGTAIWNQFDFSQPNVGGVSNNMNQKGMVTWDRKPKDSYYLYKANWNAEPMVYIASRDWTHRAGLSGSTATIEVYSNLDEVSLMVNGVSYGAKQPDHVKKMIWKVKLNEGVNDIDARGKSAKGLVNDHLNLNYDVYTENLKNTALPFSQLAVNVGSNAQYLDNSDHIWLEDRPYKTGSFGYIGGSPAMLNIKTVKKNTNDSPLFYTYQDDIKGYRFDVPDGRYELELCFIESDKIPANERIFEVSVNGDKLIENLDLTAQYGFGVAVRKKYRISVSNGTGLQVIFKAIKGKAVLSGIKLKAAL
ncbi:beta-galactosidase [Pedobacter sp. AK017]|uniref:glycoside hydrolase family 2 TIM barrel-domain containing protein n=1 Tax=Pedobacter sp. AK017 TaxID=2723073 RepID=UPI00161B51BC|nr:glycoside hydrolase family 2 TIM barrel-domain containing protein [Pedobacter sp. AK017]MBB5439009.1 beta-galactosidase [Pedobacter sp. AK017]